MIKTKKTVLGFTLIELLVVVAIIGLLTSIVLSQLSVARQKGNDTAKIRALQEVRSALALYYTDNGGYPFIINNLLPKYISSIGPIVYQSTFIGDILGCFTPLCPSYHLGIVLERSDNPILNLDKDIVTKNNVGTVMMDGTSDNCSLTGTHPSPPTPDKCYDITP